MCVFICSKKQEGGNGIIGKKHDSFLELCRSLTIYIFEFCLPGQVYGY